ncbi:MAG: hypothetical protein P8P49_13470 [Opitutales bacterium]|nr:hypothetical protein [Opitutales bacterium]MDG1326767.1 hypothetical protein [Opitutales bacterium]
MKRFLTLIITVLTCCDFLNAEESGKHLFILSGQSNMARFKPALWFTSGISEELGADGDLEIVVPGKEGTQILWNQRK